VPPAIGREPGPVRPEQPHAVEHVDVRVTRLGQLPPACTTLLAAATTAADGQRVARVPDPAVSRSLLLARGLLRVLLAERLGVPPVDVGLVRSPGGKPRLADDPDTAPRSLAFNVSHARDVVVVAITRSRPVGIDIEADDDRLHVDAIIRRFFPPEEAAWLLSQPAEGRRARFFRSWCRKEALLKAEGAGMRRELHTVVTPSVWFAGRPVSVPGTPGWAVMDLDVLPGFSCAVAAEGHNWFATARLWPEVSAVGGPSLSWQRTGTRPVLS
jgi:4'-phosphopantetheinyl transferase